jgi:DNA-binding transcriptional MerR regulator
LARVSSDDDLDRLRRITELVDQGVNLAGIAHILDLEARNSQLETDYTQLEVLNARLKADQRPTPGRNATPKNGGRIPATADGDETPEPPRGQTPNRSARQPFAPPVNLPGGRYRA